jgi:hypothetical protein
MKITPSSYSLINAKYTVLNMQNYAIVFSIHYFLYKFKMSCLTDLINIARRRYFKTAYSGPFVVSLVDYAREYLFLI